MPFQLHTPVISRIFSFLLSISTLGTSPLNKWAFNTHQSQYVQDLDCSDFFFLPLIFLSLKPLKQFVNLQICIFNSVYYNLPLILGFVVILRVETEACCVAQAGLELAL